MTDKQILMLSSSKSGNETYLSSAREFIFPFLNNIQKVLFVPYAGVTMSWDAYTTKVQQALPELTVSGIHRATNPAKAIEQAEAIMVGGGNTFNLLHQLCENNLIDTVQARVLDGTPYIGWSAGSNICGNSIRTTNDMPIIEPKSFDALKLVPFQLNPHYTDYQPPGHNGETRAQRIAEFCVLNPTMPVIGIREGSALLARGNNMSLLGSESAVVFLDSSISTLSTDQDLSTYLS